MLDTFMRACHEIAERRLSLCSSGNLSYRTEDDLVLITASRSWMSRMTEEFVSVVRLSDGELIKGRTPSVETGMHLGLLRTRPDKKIVLHFQSPAATAVACREREKFDFSVIPEIPYYIGTIGRVPYITPGTKELADAVVDSMGTNDLVILKKHGLILVADTFEHAIQNAEFFELACNVILRNEGQTFALTAEEIEGLTSG